MDIRWDIIETYAPFFLQGTLLTIGICLASIFFGTILGLGIGLGRMSKHKIIRTPFTVYVDIIRGTPLLVLIMIVHFGISTPVFGISNGIFSAILSLSLNSAAYCAEIFRAGVQSIDRGQMEAARSLGLSHYKAMRFVILPQAIKRMIPPFVNEFIVLIKDSSLASIVAAKELMYWAKAAQGQYLRVWESYLTIAIIYLILTLTLSKVLNRLERKYRTE
ncbi:amino acid ABC transporter permease [Paenibacillus albiflavus]|uniref:Amino acid ABC transporter permease n=1 Tax=Paenibacillus albiflavus TaxID=2545760 RepID=A0A4V2WMZ7_9BACL|nr:amino acid ABC transporter permease [Paenibacillus albiflavus]TCZ73552.1 amino acid ABC transporter permease [Paenibacillus albiflavus]